MKINRLVIVLATVVAVIGMRANMLGQGTVMFNYPWADGGISYPSLYYDNSGISLGIGNRTPPFDGMMHIGGIGPASYPHNGTPYMAFVNRLGTPQYIVFAWTNAASLGQSFLNGAQFGLVSVDLADPVAPSLSPVSITFNAFRPDGSMVSQAFTTLGSGSSFQTFYFGPDFASGITRVEIPSAAWAIDNIVFVPEPGSGMLLLFGLAGLLLRHRAR